MQKTAVFRHEHAQTPSARFVAVYAVLVLALMAINLAGYGLIALTA
jgi:hypothetical protein